MMNTRVRLLALYAGQAARKPSSPALQLRLVHGSHIFSSPATNYRRALMLLTAGVSSIAVYHSLRSPHDEFESAPVAPSTVPRSHVVDETNTSLPPAAPAGSFATRCRDAVVMALRCAVVYVTLLPASVLFVLNRLSNGYIVGELYVARVMTSSLQLLGPAAIKFGQWASSREDLFSPIVTRELGRLQSNAEPHPLEHTLEEANKMLEQFRKFNPSQAPVRLEDIHSVPIGSGSIAQVTHVKSNKHSKASSIDNADLKVHRAKLVGFEHDSPLNVVIKVLHPFVRQQLLLDTQIFCSLAKIISRLPRAWTFGTEAAAAQFKDHLLAQLDLRTEHSNIQRFRENFRTDSTVLFPGVFDGLCTESCLVETWEEGEGLMDFFSRIDRARLASSLAIYTNYDELNLHSGHSRSPSSLQNSSPKTALSNTLPPPNTSQLLDRMTADEILQLSQKLGTVGASAFLKMLIRDNFVHADLHPGNMIVRLEVCDGLLRHKLIMCDAGLVGSMNAKATANFIELFHAVLRGDGRTAGLLMVDNAPRQECIDKEAFASGVACIVDRVISSGFQLKSTSISSILTQMFSLARQYRVQIDGAYATTAVALAILEGTGKRLNSSIDLFKLALPLVVEKRAKQLLNMA